MPEGIAIIGTSKEEPIKPPVSIPMDKDESKGLSMDDEVTITIRGRISGLHTMFDDKFSMVELKDQKILSTEMNKADKALKDMKQSVEVMNEADRGLRDSLEG